VLNCDHLTFQIRSAAADYVQEELDKQKVKAK
jgi:hypothetical protein